MLFHMNFNFNCKCFGLDFGGNLRKSTKEVCFYIILGDANSIKKKSDENLDKVKTSC